MISVSELQAECERRVGAFSEDTDEMKPTEGWHTLAVGGGYSEPDEGAINTWRRLFALYAVHRLGTLYWHTVPHWDREKRELVAKFCIQ